MRQFKKRINFSSRTLKHGYDVQIRIVLAIGWCNNKRDGETRVNEKFKVIFWCNDRVVWFMYHKSDKNVDIVKLIIISTRNVAINIKITLSLY